MRILLLATLIVCIGSSVFAQVKKSVAKPKPKVIVKTPVVSLKSSIAAGQIIYNSRCLSCHQADGGGVPNLNAPLIKTSYVLGPKEPLINILLKGMKDVEIDGETYSNVMPPHNSLTNKQIADVLNFVRNNFGNKASMVSPAEVAAVRSKK